MGKVIARRRDRPAAGESGTGQGAGARGRLHAPHRVSETIGGSEVAPEPRASPPADCPEGGEYDAAHCSREGGFLCVIVHPNAVQPLRWNDERLNGTVNALVQAVDAAFLALLCLHQRLLCFVNGGCRHATRRRKIPARTELPASRSHAVSILGQPGGDLRTTAPGDGTLAGTRRLEGHLAQCGFDRRSPYGGPRRMRTSADGRSRFCSSPRASPAGGIIDVRGNDLPLMPLVRHGDCLLCSPMETAPAPYRQRDPKASPLYQLVVDHYEGLEELCRDRYEETYGPQQGHWENAVSRFLKCGDVFYGFARVWCSTCRHTYLVPFTCRSRGLCRW